MKNLGEELKKELGPGSDFEKEMKNLGVELNKELGPGSEFEKQMKNLGKELEKQFGPGSEFEKGMKAKGKEIEGKFGPGSDFEKRMKRFGERMEARFGEGSEFAEKMKGATNDVKDEDVVDVSGQEDKDQGKKEDKYVRESARSQGFESANRRTERPAQKAPGSRRRRERLIVRDE